MLSHSLLLQKYIKFYINFSTIEKSIASQESQNTNYNSLLVFKTSGLTSVACRDEIIGILLTAPFSLALASLVNFFIFSCSELK